MSKLLGIICIVGTFLYSSIVSAEECDISGIWNHSSKPATLFIELNKAEITVHSHETNPESVGLVALNSLKFNKIENYWKAKMYSALDGVFVEVKITSQGCHQLTVSYRGEDVLGLVR